jgi:hypothetical protein
MVGKGLRSGLAVLGGIVLISIVVEVLEFGLVTLVHGGPTSDPSVYYKVRNSPWFLFLKILYNTGSALLGGYVGAWIAGYHEWRHGLALASVQTLAFIWAFSRPDMRRWMPTWVWVALAVLSIVGILTGASLRAGRARAGS